MTRRWMGAAASVLLLLTLPGSGAAVPRAENPLIWADVPDPSIIRVGERYYMSSTTMHMSPGLPIMRSEDLVNWQIIGYAYDRLADNAALNLERGENAYGAGSWASSLRYHDGTYYVSTFSSTTGRTHIYRTEDIEEGPWIENAFSPSLHDSSLHFEEDGGVFMVYGSGDIRLIELEEDLSGIKAGGLDEVIVPDSSRVAGGEVMLPSEGSHLRKINGVYYLSLITWPKGDMRTQLVFRSDKLRGPYEGRVVLRDEGVAQGGLIDTPEGDWYAFLFQDHGAVGRVPYLVPVSWEEGWPVHGVEGRAPVTLEIPAGSGGLGNLVLSDEFDRTSSGHEAEERGKAVGTFPLAWQWNHNPDDRHWSLEARPGWLRLTTGRVDAELVDARNMLTQRTFGPESRVSVAIDVSGMRSGDFGGLALLQRHYGFVGVKDVEGIKSVVVVKAESGASVEEAAVPVDQEVVYLKATCDFREQRDVAQFFYSLDGEHWEGIGGELKMRYTLPHFMGYRFGLFNFATEQTGGYVDFDFFRLGEDR